MAQITFSVLLTQIMNSSDMNLRQVHKELENREISISYPSLAAYKNFTAVPGLDKAQQVLSVFDYQIDNKELQEILAYSSKELKLLRDEQRNYIQQSVRLMPGLFGTDVTKSSLEITLDDRLREIYGDAGTFNTYVNELIRKDLVNSGYIQNKENEK